MAKRLTREQLKIRVDELEDEVSNLRRELKNNRDLIDFVHGFRPEFGNPLALEATVQNLRHVAFFIERFMFAKIPWYGPKAGFKPGPTWPGKAPTDAELSGEPGRIGEKLMAPPPVEREDD